ncbi:MAG: tRNA 2-thiocytidine biosynthesis protein TtcA [Clostridia bacterium]|nr:tRNA 2-thiocytidine biosynthesis protein TtcA [Clostridia bacterium]
MSRELTTCQLIERSINKKYRKELWTPFMHAIRQYELISPGDRIAVCISGGKDSMLMAKLMQELSRHSTIPFELCFLVMNPGYNPANQQKIEDNAKLMEIPIEVFESNVFDAANSADDNPCYLCARMRRGFLYSEAKRRGCNKIALGHHFNDVIETTVLGMFYGAQLQAMLPKLHSKNFEGMELIRPLYCIHEADIIAWRDYNHLSFLQCACRFTEQAAADIQRNGNSNSKRLEIKHLIASLKKDNPDIEKSIFNSIHACCLDTMVGWKSKGHVFSFLDCYDRAEE